eukprot:g8175.t1
MKSIAVLAQWGAAAAFSPGDCAFVGIYGDKDDFAVLLLEDVNGESLSLTDANFKDRDLKVDQWQWAEAKAHLSSFTVASGNTTTMPTSTTEDDDDDDDDESTTEEQVTSTEEQVTSTEEHTAPVRRGWRIRGPGAADAVAAASTSSGSAMPDELLEPFSPFGSDEVPLSQREFQQLLLEEDVDRLLRGIGVDVVALVDTADVIYEDFNKFGMSMTFENLVETILNLRGKNTATVKDRGRSQGVPVERLEDVKEQSRVIKSVVQQTLQANGSKVMEEFQYLRAELALLREKALRRDEDDEDEDYNLLPVETAEVEVQERPVETEQIFGPSPDSQLRVSRGPSQGMRWGSPK